MGRVEEPDSKRASRSALILSTIADSDAFDRIAMKNSLDFWKTSRQEGDGEACREGALSPPAEDWSGKN